MAYTTIKKPSDYFNTVLYTGNGSTNNITGVGFQPDFTWIKVRSQALNHYLYDAVRGVENKISSNTTGGEIDMGTSGLNTFGTDGFTVGNDTDENASGQTYASWNWLADNTSGSANTDGSISSTVSANTTSGFSIGTWLGNSSASATVGHGLGTTPAVIITKELNGTDYWHVWHKNLTNPNNLFLNTTLAQQAPPDGTLSNVGSSTFGFQGATNVVAVNESGINNVFYCFAEVQGYSKFGSYVGNGNADGAFVYTGFKPAFVLVKNTQQGGDDWYMFDNKRSSFNQVQANLKPNTTSVEASSTSYAFDFLSNGFKVRASTGAINNNNETMIYMAFAEQPLVGDNPATAR